MNFSEASFFLTIQITSPVADPEGFPWFPLKPPFEIV